MRCVSLLVVAAACSGGGAKETPPPIAAVKDASPSTTAAAPPQLEGRAALPAHRAYPDLAAALVATIPATTQVVGIGELHARTDRAQVRSALAHFTEALPAFGARVSDLIVETWIVDPKCGKQAVQTTAKVEATVKRPAATKSEITLLADAARALKIQPHAMTLACKDYEALTTAKGEADPIAMLSLTTRELARIMTSALRFRAKQPDRRPWIALYGGALHNDRFPAAGVAEWSYAETADLATDGNYVEIDLIVPELAEADSVSNQQPWFPLVAAATQVLVYERGERSFVVVLPRDRGTAPPAPAPAP